MSLKTYRLPPLSGNAPDSIVIFLHGLGDNGAGGLLELGRVWHRVLPNTEFLCPDAPFEFDMATPGFVGRQWFSLREFTQHSVEKGVREAAPILNAYIDEVLHRYNLPASRLALVGFSQGTMMSIDAALHRTEPVAAIVGYSGKWGSGEYTPPENKNFPPILLIHGTADPVVPFAAMAEAEHLLKQAGAPVVRTLACPRLAHSVDDAGIQAGMMFIEKYLK